MLLYSKVMENIKIQVCYVRHIIQRRLKIIFIYFMVFKRFYNN